MAPGPLGWIPPSQRSQAQQDEHNAIMGRAPRFALARPVVPKGTKIILNDFFARPEVVADIGEVFTGFHQLTGSCVGVSMGNAIAVLSAIQRTIADNPTVAMVPWWGFNYGRSRALAGFRGQGEGSIDSFIGKSGVEDGVLGVTEAGFQSPSFDKADGWVVASSVEMRWSDGNSSLVTGVASIAKQFPLGGMAPLEDVDGIAASIINGYPVLDGCDNYMGSGRVSAKGYTVAHYDGRGGHSTCFSAYWEHPDDGPLYGYWNQWPASTYPKDPAGLARCMAWTPESEAAKLFRTGGSDGETMSLSHLNYHPAQPKVLDYSQF